MSEHSFYWFVFRGLLWKDQDETEVSRRFVHLKLYYISLCMNFLTSYSSKHKLSWLTEDRKMKLIPNFSSRKLLLLLLLLCGVWLSLSAVRWWMTSRDSYRQSLLYICLPTMHCTSQQEMRKAPLRWHTHTHEKKNNFQLFNFVTFFTLLVTPAGDSRRDS